MISDKLIILTTTFNCENFIEKCLYSIMSQKHKNFMCFITDDMSNDNTVTKIEETIKSDNRFLLIKNSKKLYQPGNYNQIIRNENYVKDEDICVEIDGDDWLPDSKVFDRIIDTYSDEKIWIANGSFKYHNGNLGFAKELKNVENIRKEVFTLSHLRTWKSFLWKQISEKDLKNDNGEFYEVAGDLSFMYPMVEMSGLEHYKFMPEINYIYNESNPLNDHKVNLPKVQKIVSQIRNKPSYKKIER